MATLANQLWKASRPVEGGRGTQDEWRTDPDSEPGPAPRNGGNAAAEDPFLLRPLPNEDVFLFIKRFDNTGVVRQVDPRTGDAAWKVIGGACMAATLLIGLLLPGAYRTLAGYRIDELKRTRDQAVRELRTLEYQEASLTNMERVNEVAKTSDFTAPSGDQVQFLQPKDSVASLKKP